ncbi:hypothetical protein [Hoeflea poritis]|uniref:Uncharacterized protein n=1 Tax=Hoeflea poritis TaxID=2993659 RepID=A0ABT4VUZ9_9HYPH|nr:hypothetical protein [Hoeflea poritis]MDA4848025.1 hypothetical protein [Hoeflea poritis]
MPIPVMLDSLDDLSDEMKENYAKDEKSGKFLLQIEGLEEHPDVRGLSTANKTNRTKRDELKAENEDPQKSLEETEAKLSKTSEFPEGYSKERWNELLALEDIRLNRFSAIKCSSLGQARSNRRAVRRGICESR